MQRTFPLLTAFLALGFALTCWSSCTQSGSTPQSEEQQAADSTQNAGVETNAQPGTYTKPYDKIEVINSIWSPSSRSLKFIVKPFALIYEIDLDKDGLNELYIELGAQNTTDRLYALCAMGGGKMDKVAYTSSPYGERITLFEGGGVSRSWYSGTSGETPDTYILIQGSQTTVMMEGDVSIEYNDSLKRPMISGSARNMINGEEMTRQQVQALDPAFSHKIQLDSAKAITVML